jgi:four helix bundle protein
MASFKSLEEIESWKSARELCKLIFTEIKKPNFAKDFALKDQINRASGSIMDNIAEGFGRGGNKEFILFLGYSSGSAMETKSQLYRALDRNYISKNDFNLMFNLANSIGKMNGGLIDYLNSSDLRGRKFIAAPTKN